MKASAVLLTLVCLCGCMVGPNYHRPTYPVPQKYRGEGPGIPSRPVVESFGELKWFEVFKDPQLQKLIEIALKQNYDVRVAAQRLLAAREQITITRSSLFPQLNLGGQWETTRISERAQAFFFPQTDISVGSIFGDLSWELDFFGRIRRAVEASQADFFASDWNRKLIIQTLVTTLAQSYFQLLGLDLQLEIAQRTVKNRREYLKLEKLRFEFGWDSLAPVYMSENLLYGATQTIPPLQRLREETENQISILLGRNPGKIKRGKPLLEQNLKVTVPPGLPSALLERRPDIRYAEEQLVAANAQVGQATALLFPQITLTGTAGWQSKALSHLFSGPASFWDIVAGLAQPIFRAGSLRAGLRQQEALKEAAVLNYKKTVQQAFQDVSNALVAVRKVHDTRIEIEKRQQALALQTQLS
ncbi:MAG TPA: efflux transporter outer membrane subunit, partial [Desulfobaccales bacterium]|nr:efflux transporter outer membrane subunit [Desulfobaccales bacterium]